MTVLFVAILTTTGGCSSTHTPVKKHTQVKTQRASVKHNLSKQTNVADASQSQQNSRGLSREELNDIRRAGDNICFPSKVRILEMQEDEILREIEVDSGLSGEAVNDLLVLRDKLASLEGESNELTIKDSCPDRTIPATEIASSGYKPTGKILKLNNSLLNADNKSSLFSAVTKATPKYFKKLANVLTQLREQEGYQLKITGDIDRKPTDFDNMNLSSRPELKSESYLQITVELKF